MDCKGIACEGRFSVVSPCMSIVLLFKFHYATSQKLIPLETVLSVANNTRVTEGGGACIL